MRVTRSMSKGIVIRNDSSIPQNERPKESARSCSDESVKETSLSPQKVIVITTLVNGEGGVSPKDSEK